MNEILITSSVMIGCLLILRLLFAKKVSRRLIYAAWLLVALRLLVPVQIGELDFSVLTAAQPLTETMTEFEELRVFGQTENDAHKQVIEDYIENDRTVFTPEVQQQIADRLENGNMSSKETADYLHKVWNDEEIFTPESREEVAQQVADATDPVSLGQVATVLWLCGVAGMAVWFLLVNLRYSRKLRQGADRLACESPIPVYVSEKMDTPCLVGLFCPRIYLTPASAADTKKLRHVLTHEQTHYAHKDHIWSVIRCLCLCVYWFHPLVWAAAFLSRRDCELACDEGALKRLGEAERIPYGKTLLEEVSHAATPGKLLQTATAMSETKKQLKERIEFIVSKRKISAVAVIAMLLICAIVAGCVAAGPTSDQQIVEPNPSTSTQPSNPIASSGNSQTEPATMEVYDYSLGKTVTITLTPAELDVNGFTLEYSWAVYDGMLYTKSYSNSIALVKDSDRYLHAHMEGGLSYRINVQTGEVFDPQKYLDFVPVSPVVYFSSDGNYAVASYANRFCTLINCVTAEVTELPFEADVYAIEAMFVDDANILLMSRHEVGSKMEYSFGVYHIPTGECTEIPGRYQSKYYDQDNFLKISWDGILYKFVDGKLAIIDPLTWKSVIYPLGEGAEVSYYRDGVLLAVFNGLEYLLYKDGTYQQVGKEIEGPIIPGPTDPEPTEPEPTEPEPTEPEPTDPEPTEPEPTEPEPTLSAEDEILYERAVAALDAYTAGEQAYFFDESGEYYGQDALWQICSQLLRLDEYIDCSDYLQNFDIKDLKVGEVWRISTGNTEDAYKTVENNQFTYNDRGLLTGMYTIAQYGSFHFTAYSDLKFFYSGDRLEYFEVYDDIYLLATVICIYDDNGFLTEEKVTGSYEYSICYAYDAAGRLSGWTSTRTEGAESKTEMVYIYDAQGRLVQTKRSYYLADYMFPDQVELVETEVADYSYDFNGFLASISADIFSWNDGEVSNMINQTTTFTYDSYGRVLTQYCKTGPMTDLEGNVLDDITRHWEEVTYSYETRIYYLP